jgi:hypothetical protein
VRRLVTVVAATCALAALQAAPAHADSVSPTCFSPPPFTPTSCAAWHDQPVRLEWVISLPSVQNPPGNCKTPQAFQTEGETDFSCRVQNSDGSFTTGEVTLRIDRTPPVISGATPSRPPDDNGWWNRPLSFSFSGSDALSGVASCDSGVLYAGPGGPGAQVVGGCHDNAGNYGTRAFALNFDSTPPALANVKAKPASRSAVVSWDASPDTVLTQVVRTPGLRGRAPSVVYSGNGRRFSDSGMTNGTTYRYTISAFDPAGNNSSQTVAAKPEISLGLKPPRGARMKHAPRLRWPAVRGARYYNLQVYRGKHKLLTAWPGSAKLDLGRRHHGRRFRLPPGHYRWYVWPGYGSRAAHHYGAFIGQSSFVIVRR